MQNEMSSRQEFIKFGDDKAWIKRNKLFLLQFLLFDPLGFIRPHTLKSPYTISFAKLSKGTVTPTHFLLAGVDGTNHLSIQRATPDPGGAMPTGAAFDHSVISLSEGALARFEQKSSEWFDALKGFEAKEIDIAISVSDNRAYVHFPLWKEGESSPEERAAKLAAFHSHAAADKDYIHSLLKTENIKSVTYYVKDGKGDLVEDTATIYPGIVFDKPTDFVPLTFLGRAQDDESKRTRDNPEEACEILVAEYNLGHITYEEAYCKAYAGP